jgi:hypothetical protein
LRSGLGQQRLVVTRGKQVFRDSPHSSKVLIGVQNPVVRPNNQNPVICGLQRPFEDRIPRFLPPPAKLQLPPRQPGQQGKDKHHGKRQSGLPIPGH